MNAALRPLAADGQRATLAPAGRERRPASLLARTSLALAISAALIATTAVLAMNMFVITPIAERSAQHEAALMVLSAQTWVELPPEARPYFELELAEQHDLILAPVGRKLPWLESPRPYLAQLQTALSERLGEPVRLRSADELVWADIPMGGFVLQIGVDPQRTDTAPFYVGLLITALGAMIVLVTSLLIVQRLTRPLVAAARAAEQFRGRPVRAPLPEEGPRELVTLARSFNTMAREVADLIDNRTTLLAGISHDLRTPIARMRLAIELLPDDVDPVLVERLQRNLIAMDELIRAALQFARGLASEDRTWLALDAWVEQWLAGREGEPVRFTWHGARPCAVQCAPTVLERVLENLVANAGQHGGGDVEVVGHSADDSGPACIHVLDRGAGIPEAARQQVFRPFFRLELSRNRASGGSGLGLAIVDQLCRAQGWLIDVRERTGGGSDFCLTLAAAGVSGATATA